MSTTTLDDVRQEPADAGRPTWHLLLAGLLVVLALGGGLLLGRGMDDGATHDDPVDVGFVQDMKVHHAQAVEMSAIVHARTDDPELSFLALDITLTQQGQIGIMTGWLDLWGQSQTTTRPVMEWMGDGGGHGMVGMATDDEISALEMLPVAKMEEQFLRLMIRHHRGALPMAAYAAAEGTSPELTSLARGMEEGQAFEIDVMQDLLSKRGLPLEPEDHGGHG